ncbi:MAG: hypothetical protein IKP26_05080 [Clostridia bacterium]|nr:hypothetical protein [Clostridia bacterium]
MKKILLPLMAAMLLLLPGCLSPVSPEAYGYVIAIGADGGEDARYYYTLQLQRELSEPSSEHEGGALILGIEGDSLEEAVTKLEGNLPFTLSFSRTNLFVFSRALAEAGEVETLLSLSFDRLKIRRSAVLAVSEGAALEFLGGLSAGNDANIRKLREAVMLDMEKTGMISITSVAGLFEATETGLFDHTAALGVYEPDTVTDPEQKKAENEGKNPVESAKPDSRIGGIKTVMTGTALFSGWRMTGALTRDETLFLNIARGELKSGALTLREGDGSVALMLKKRSLKREISIDENGVKARVRVTLEAAVLSHPPGMTGGELEEFVENDAAKRIEESLYSVFLKCREADSDAMRFGTDAVRLFPSYEEWRAFDWKRRYPGMEAEFEVRIVTP